MGEPKLRGATISAARIFSPACLGGSPSRCSSKSCPCLLLHICAAHLLQCCSDATAARQRCLRSRLAPTASKLVSQLMRQRLSSCRRSRSTCASRSQCAPKLSAWLVRTELLSLKEWLQAPTLSGLVVQICLSPCTVTSFSGLERVVEVRSRVGGRASR